MKNFIVEYVLAYDHVVQVGVRAATKLSACLKAEKAFDAGTIWDDTPDMPLIYDDYEEGADSSALTFTAMEVKELPAKSPSVVTAQLHAKARKMQAALQALIDMQATTVLDSDPRYAEIVKLAREALK